MTAEGKTGMSCAVLAALATAWGACAAAMATTETRDGSASEKGRRIIRVALVLQGAKHCRFEDCAFEALEGFAVDVRAGSRENVFSRCRFSGLGGGAVRIDGGTMDAHPSARTRGNVITDCEIGDYGLDWASAGFAGICVGVRAAGRFAGRAEEGVCKGQMKGGCVWHVNG